MSMDNTDVVRMRCPTCERRLEVPTTAKFVACARCGSEYTVNRRGGAISLSPYLDQVQELNEQIVHAEQQQAGGCANLTISSVGLGAVAFFIFGVLGLLFKQPALGCFAGWLIAIAIVFFGFSFAGRYVNSDQIRLDRLQQAREQAATGGNEANPEADVERDEPADTVEESA
jgi:DNA-directed RNA polymerase subunit RPC12/RpoP